MAIIYHKSSELLNKVLYIEDSQADNTTQSVFLNEQVAFVAWRQISHTEDNAAVSKVYVGNLETAPILLSSSNTSGSSTTNNDAILIHANGFINFSSEERHSLSSKSYTIKNKNSYSEYIQHRKDKTSALKLSTSINVTIKSLITEVLSKSVVNITSSQVFLKNKDYISQISTGGITFATTIVSLRLYMFQGIITVMRFSDAVHIGDAFWMAPGPQKILMLLGFAGMGIDMVLAMKLEAEITQEVKKSSAELLSAFKQNSKMLEDFKKQREEKLGQLAYYDSNYAAISLAISDQQNMTDNFMFTQDADIFDRNERYGQAALFPVYNLDKTLVHGSHVFKNDLVKGNLDYSSFIKQEHKTADIFDRKSGLKKISNEAAGNKSVMGIKKDAAVTASSYADQPTMEAARKRAEMNPRSNMKISKIEDQLNEALLDDNVEAEYKKMQQTKKDTLLRNHSDDIGEIKFNHSDDLVKQEAELKKKKVELDKKISAIELREKLDNSGKNSVEYKKTAIKEHYNAQVDAEVKKFVSDRAKSIYPDVAYYRNPNLGMNANSNLFSKKEMEFMKQWGGSADPKNPRLSTPVDFKGGTFTKKIDGVRGGLSDPYKAFSDRASAMYKKKYQSSVLGKVRPDLAEKINSSQSVNISYAKEVHEKFSKKYMEHSKDLRKTLESGTLASNTTEGVNRHIQDSGKKFLEQFSLTEQDDLKVLFGTSNLDDINKTLSNNPALLIFKEELKSTEATSSMRRLSQQINDFGYTDSPTKVRGNTFLNPKKQVEPLVRSISRQMDQLSENLENNAKTMNNADSIREAAEKIIVQNRETTAILERKLRAQHLKQKELLDDARSKRAANNKLPSSSNALDVDEVYLEEKKVEVNKIESVLKKHEDKPDVAPASNLDEVDAPKVKADPSIFKKHQAVVTKLEVKIRQLYDYRDTVLSGIKRYREVVDKKSAFLPNVANQNERLGSLQKIFKEVGDSISILEERIDKHKVKMQSLPKNDAALKIKDLEIENDLLKKRINDYTQAITEFSKNMTNDADQLLHIKKSTEEAISKFKAKVNDLAKTMDVAKLPDSKEMKKLISSYAAEMKPILEDNKFFLQQQRSQGAVNKITADALHDMLTSQSTLSPSNFHFEAEKILTDKQHIQKTKAVLLNKDVDLTFKKIEDNNAFLKYDYKPGTVKHIKNHANIKSEFKSLQYEWKKMQEKKSANTKVRPSAVEDFADQTENLKKKLQEFEKKVPTLQFSEKEGFARKPAIENLSSSLSKAYDDSLKNVGGSGSSLKVAHDTFWSTATHNPEDSKDMLKALNENSFDDFSKALSNRTQQVAGNVKLDPNQMKNFFSTLVETNTSKNLSKFYQHSATLTLDSKILFSAFQRADGHANGLTITDIPVAEESKISQLEKQTARGSESKFFQDFSEVKVAAQDNISKVLQAKSGDALSFFSGGGTAGNRFSTGFSTKRLKNFHDSYKKVNIQNTQLGQFMSRIDGSDAVKGKTAFSLINDGINGFTEKANSSAAMLFDAVNFTSPKNAENPFVKNIELDKGVMLKTELKHSLSNQSTKSLFSNGGVLEETNSSAQNFSDIIKKQGAEKTGGYYELVNDMKISKEAKSALFNSDPLIAAKLQFSSAMSVPHKSSTLANLNIPNPSKSVEAIEKIEVLELQKSPPILESPFPSMGNLESLEPVRVEFDSELPGPSTAFDEVDSAPRVQSGTEFTTRPDSPWKSVSSGVPTPLEGRNLLTSNVVNGVTVPSVMKQGLKTTAQQMFSKSALKMDFVTFKKQAFAGYKPLINKIKKLRAPKIMPLIPPRPHTGKNGSESQEAVTEQENIVAGVSQSTVTVHI